MKKVIVTTTIYAPNEAIRRFEAMQDWDLVVIGDRKTPADYRLQRGVYVPPEDQERYDKPLSDAIGWNCIQRRILGLLWAHDLHADIVAIVDDDNIPFEGWGQDLMIGKEVEVDYYETEAPAFDPIGATNYPHLWHRGFPLQLVPTRDYRKKSRRKVTVDVQADFWNGDPDIDAILRITQAPECTFDPKYFPMAANRIGPFNSQNTFLAGKCLKDYIVFPHAGRLDDIWGSYYLQGKGAQVVWAKPSVYQERNPHDLVRDMRMEYGGYENNLQLVQDVMCDPESIGAYMPGRAMWAFELYKRHFRSY